MAQTTRTRIIANPARRKLSRAQIAAGFGAKRRRSSLSKRRSRSNSRHRPRRKNPGEIIGYTFAHNPAKRKGKKHMAATRKRSRRRNAGGRRYHRRRRSNPARRRSFAVVHHRRHRRRSNPARRFHRRRNPSSISGLGGLAINAVFVIAGALGSKLLTQMVLGANNTGVVGYAGNAISGGVLWFLAEKVMKNRSAAHGIIAGTAVQIVLRLINDFTPFGQYVANLGMGDYQAQAFVTPQVLVDPYNSAALRIPQGWGAPPPAVSMPAHVGMGGLERLYSGSGDLY